MKVLKEASNVFQESWQRSFKGVSGGVSRIVQKCFNPTSYGISDSVAARGGGLKDPYPSDIMEGLILDPILL